MLVLNQTLRSKYMNYKHLTIEERACIKKYVEMKISMREIAKLLDRSPSTISRELKRNSYKKSVNYSVTGYSPLQANNKYKNRRLNCHRKVNLNNDILNLLQNQLLLNWSPDQVVNYHHNALYNLPSVSTIYRWIHKGYLKKIKMINLRRKGNFKRPAETRGKFNIGKTIKKRPKEVFNRNTFGHWEADTVVSGRIDGKAKSSYCFVTLAERKSRLYVCKHISDRKEETVTKAIVELLSKFPKELVKTITCDRGKEFAGWKTIEEKLDCNMYFADPYCAWQKGTNENSNGLLREYYPKGMDLSLTNDKELTKNLHLLNNRPRKCINYKTPNEVINEFIACCT